MRGVDVSSYQGNVDWYAAHQGGIEVAVAKATEGATYIDVALAHNRMGAAKVGLKFGMYHFARPSKHAPHDEALHFLNTIGTLAEHEFAVLDMEDSSFAGPVWGWCVAWLREVENVTGRPPMFYTYKPYWQSHGSPDASMAHYPLWLAAYSDKQPTPMAPWTELAGWQHTSTGTCAGITGRCDLDTFFTLPITEDDMYSDADRARDDKMAENVQAIYDAIYTGDTHYGVFPGMEGMTRDTWKKVMGR